MLTVVETLLFQKQWPLYWIEDERGTPETWCLGAVVFERSAGVGLVLVSLVECASSTTRERSRKKLFF